MVSKYAMLLSIATMHRITLLINFMSCLFCRHEHLYTYSLHIFDDMTNMVVPILVTSKRKCWFMKFNFSRLLDYLCVRTADSQKFLTTKYEYHNSFPYGETYLVFYLELRPLSYLNCRNEFGLSTV